MQFGPRARRIEKANMTSGSKWLLVLNASCATVAGGTMCSDDANVYLHVHNLIHVTCLSCMCAHRHASENIELGGIFSNRVYGTVKSWTTERLDLQAPYRT